MQPSDRQIKTLRAIADMEQGKTTYVNPADVEECIDKQWVEPLAGGGYHLTALGRRVLTKSD